MDNKKPAPGTIRETGYGAAFDSLNFNTPKPDQGAILAALSDLFEPDDVIELRAFHKGRKRTDAGYFDGAHREALADAAAKLNATGAAVYVTLNRLDSQLLGRYCNRVENFASATATDANVTRRRWLLLDFDPNRPKDTSATESQLEAAKATARKCYQALQADGWPEPMAAESGNGMHLLYPLDLPNDNASRDLVKGALAGLAARFDDDVVKLDQSVFNAGRITKLYGTVGTKGDPTPATPWRLSRLVSIPGRDDVVTEDQLRAWHPAATQTAPKTSYSTDTRRDDFDLPGFMSRLGIAYDQDTHEGAERLKLDHCPFNPEHGKGEAAIFRQPGGRLGFKCQHNSCADRTWQDVRGLVDGVREARSRAQADLSVRPVAEQHGGTDNAPGGDYLKAMELIRGCDITPEAVTWVWDGWLAAGKMHVLGGAPGTGKTTISMGLAATVTTGGRWPDGSQSLAGNVVIWSGEDDPADTLVPRLSLSGADLNRVYFISDVREGKERRSFDPSKDMDVLRRKLAEIGDVRLLIVDPIVSAITGDSHKNAEVRRGLQPLVDLAAAMRCVLLGITHFSKGTGGRDPVERLTGSLAFGALARVVLVAAKHQEEGDDGRTVRLLLRAKSNIGPDDGGFEYDLHQGELKTHPGVFTSSVLWGQSVEGAARELLASADATGDDGEGGTLTDAKRFLSDLLSDGPVPSKMVRADADGAGFSWATIRRAQKALGIEAEKEGGIGDSKQHWFWKLPEMPKVLKNREDAQQKKVSTFGKNEHLRESPPEKTVIEVEI